MTTLVIVRHGATAWNEQRLFLGRRDVPLSEGGRRQAVALGEALHGDAFNRVYASPLRRTVETARLLGHEPVLLPELVEIDRGEWEGLPSEEIRRRDAELHDRWYDDPTGLAMPGGEAFDDLWERARRALALLAEGGGTVLAVGHKAINRVLIAHALGREAKGVWAIPQPQACRSVLRAEDGRWRAELLGDVAHLPPELRSDS